MRRPTDELSILLVDDDVDICGNMSDILSDLGYRVEVAHDGLTALEMVNRRPFDVALLDLKMPGMDGLTLYREIKKTRAETVAILVTGYASQQTAIDALTRGIWQVVSKPVDFPQLQEMVEKALGQPLVLVVDDDQDLCENLWDLLRERGFRVCLAHGETQGTERLRDRTYQVVLIDLKLPDGSGFHLFEVLREANPEAFAVLITGHRAEMDERIGQLLAQGAAAVHYKPFDVSKLLSTLEHLV